MRTVSVRLDHKLIGLHGGKGHGKDTVAQFMMDWFAERGELVSVSYFARTMKASLAALLKIPLEQIDDFKLNGMLSVWMDEEQFEPTVELTGREVLQRYGTESHREFFGYDVWIDLELPKGGYPPTWWRNFQKGAAVCVMADLRFPNECARVKDLNGEVWFVNNPNLPKDDEHASEKMLPITAADLIIENDKGLSELEAKVFAILENRYG